MSASSTFSLITTAVVNDSSSCGGHCLCGVGRIQMMMGEYRQTSIDKQASTNRESLPKKKHEHSDTKRESSAKAMPSKLHVLVFVVSSVINALPTYLVHAQYSLLYCLLYYKAKERMK